MTSNQDTEAAARRLRFTSRFGEFKVDAFLVTALPNVRYLSGFTGSNGAILLTAQMSCYLPILAIKRRRRLNPTVM